MFNPGVVVMRCQGMADENKTGYLVWKSILFLDSLDTTNFFVNSNSLNIEVINHLADVSLSLSLCLSYSKPKITFYNPRAHYYQDQSSGRTCQWVQAWSRPCCLAYCYRSQLSKREAG